MTIIRAEEEEDYSQVHRVVELAFGQPDEARLVEALRQVAYPNISLVAVAGEQVVGQYYSAP